MLLASRILSAQNIHAHMKRVLFSLLFTAAAFYGYSQDLKLPALSPTAKISQDFSTSSIDITYSRPSMRGRHIYGDIVAYGEVWRTGANAATKIKFGEDVTVGDQEVKAGEYALYTIPGEGSWEVILNKGTGNWGSAGYDKAADVARFRVKAKSTERTVQTFTIEISNITLSSCHIDLMWENTMISIPVDANNQDRLTKAVDKAINNPSIPYFQAANYYFETHQQTEKAWEYINKACEQNPKAFYMFFLKARIAKKLGKREEAIEAAKKSMEAAKGSAFENDYIRQNRKIINSLR